MTEAELRQERDALDTYLRTRKRFSKSDLIKVRRSNEITEQLGETFRRTNA